MLQIGIDDSQLRTGSQAGLGQQTSTKIWRMSTSSRNKVLCGVVQEI